MEVLIDGQTVSPEGGFLIRKGPGNCFFDFAQDISCVVVQSLSQPSGNLPQR